MATVVEGYPRAHFSVATTTGCRNGCYSFPWIASLYPCYIIAEGYHFFLSFGLVRLWTVQLRARVGAHIERRCSSSCGEDVTIADVIIKTAGFLLWYLDLGNRTGDVNDVMPRSDNLRILGDSWKKAVSWDLKLDESSWV